MKKTPETMKSHKNRHGIMKNQPGTMKKLTWNHENYKKSTWNLKTTHLEPWKTNLEPWKTIKTELDPWKTNLHHYIRCRRHHRRQHHDYNHCRDHRYHYPRLNHHRCKQLRRHHHHYHGTIYLISLQNCSSLASGRRVCPDYWLPLSLLSLAHIISLNASIFIIRIIIIRIISILSLSYHQDNNYHVNDHCLSLRW